MVIKFSEYRFSKFILIFFLFASLIIGAFLRLHYIVLSSPINDELWSYYIASAKNLSLLVSNTRNLTGLTSIDPNPLGYYLILHYWMNLFGHSIYSMRLLACIFSLISILVIKKLTQKITDNETISLIAAILICINPASIYFATFSRAYSMMILFTILFLYSQYMLKNNATPPLKRHRNIWIFWHFVNAVVLANIHFFGALFVGSSLIMNSFYYFRMSSEPSIEKNNLFYVIVCELVGVLLCAAYILYNIKLFSMYLPHVSGISMGLSSDTPFKEPLSFQLIVRMADNFFGIIPFVVLFLMLLISFMVYSGQQEEKNFNHQIYKAFGVNYCGLFIVLSVTVGVFFPIVDVRNLLPILPSLILILSLLLYPLLRNIGRVIFFVIVFPIFCYLSIVYDLNFLNFPSRANENYYLLNQYIPNYPVIYTSYPNVIKSYLDISASLYHTVVLNLNSISDKNAGIKNKNHILLVDSFVLTSKLQAAVKTVLASNYACSPRTNITNMMVNNELHTLFIILTCDKKS